MFCENCGFKIQAGDKVCRNCGTPVAQEKSSNLFLILGIVGGVVLVAIIAVILFFVIGGKGHMKDISSEVGDGIENSLQEENFVESTATAIPTATPVPTATVMPTATPVPIITATPMPQVPAANNTDFYTTMYVVNCNESITLRTSPRTSASEICQIPLGAAVSYVETAGNGFYKIIYNGKTGYSLASYLDTYYHESARNAATYVNDYLTVINCNESITLRTSPSTSASEICQIPLGATVIFMDFADNGFYKVSYNNNVGYALASYLY